MMTTRTRRLLLLALAALPLHTGYGQEIQAMGPADLLRINCGNLVYATNQTSVCFADTFLAKAASETNLDVTPQFFRVALDSPDVFNFPFCVFSGEGAFSLTDQQRRHLRSYLLHGGFILSSPGCSDEEWDRSFRTEIRLIFPDFPLQKLPMSHSIFSVVHTIPALHNKKGKQVLVEGLIVNDRVVMIHSREGLNDVDNAEGCCCCGGSEISESQRVNVNALTYSLLY